MARFDFLSSGSRARTTWHSFNADNADLHSFYLQPSHACRRNLCANFAILDSSMATMTYPNGRVMTLYPDTASRPSNVEDNTTSVYCATGTCPNGVSGNGECCAPGRPARQTIARRETCAVLLRCLRTQKGRFMKIRFLRRFLPVLFLFCNSTSLFSQNQLPVVRDSRALKIVQTAINNMGATNSTSVILDCAVTGASESDSNPEVQKNFTWTIAGDEFRFEVSSANGTDLFVSGHGTPANVSNGKVSAINYHVARANLPYYLPGLLLSRELANSNFTVKYVGTARAGGRQAVQVHLSDGSDKIASLVTPQEWYFDVSSGLPLRVEFHIPTNANAGDLTKGRFDFSDFRSVGGILTPFQISFSEEPLPHRVIRFNSVRFNVGVSPSVFDAPKEVGQ